MVLGKKSSPSKNENYFYMAILRAFFKLRVLAIFIIQSQNASVKQIKHCSLVFSTAQAAWSAASSRKAPSKLQIMPLVSASPSGIGSFLCRALRPPQFTKQHSCSQILTGTGLTEFYRSKASHYSIKLRVKTIQLCYIKRFCDAYSGAGRGGLCGLRYSNIGINKIDSMLRTPNCPFVLFVGTKKLVKRKEFEQFISEKLVI